MPSPAQTRAKPRKAAANATRLGLLRKDLKRAEQQLTAARDYAEAIIRTARDPIVVLRADLRLNTANDAFYKTFQTTPSETAGCLIYELGNQQWNIPRLRTLLEDILPRNSFFNDFEVTHDFPQIGRRTMLLNARRLAQAHNQPPMVLLAIQDVTERQHSAAVAASLATIINSSDDAIIGKTLDGTITSWNKGAEKLFGYTAQEAVGRSITMLIPSDRLREETVILDKLKQGETVDHFETVRLRKDGTTLVVSLTVSPLKDSAGRVIGASKIARDITERRRAGVAQARLAAIVDSSDDAIISKTLDGIVTSWNAAAERLLGYRAEEMIGQPITKIIPPDHLAEEAEILNLLRQDRRMEHFETVRIAKDGRRIDVSLSISPIRDETGRVVGAAKIMRDISARRQAEEALRLAQTQLADRARQLEEAVDERTAELTATNKQLEAFAYSVAHDLRAPLRSMEGFSALLVEEAASNLSEQSQDFALRINRAAQFMDTLLMDLLIFSGTAQKRVELTAVRLAAVVEAALTFLQKEIHEKNARVETSGLDLTVLAHEPTLGQALLNLCSNALKFVAPGVSPVIRVRAEERAASVSSPPEGPGEDVAGRWVRVWVEDNGIGIAPEHQDQVFRLFTRLHGSNYPGTGAGLAIVQKGIERLGGRVGMDSAFGQGSRFWFELRKA